MQTWKEYMNTGGPSGFDGFSNYMGGHEHENMYVLYGRNRDSDTLENSNFETILASLGGESESVWIESFNHWACGWIELILISPDFPGKVKEAEAVLERLSDYPVFDEEHFSQKEFEEMVEGYHSFYRKRIIEAIEEAEQENETCFLINTDGEFTPDKRQEEVLFDLFLETVSGYGDVFGQRPQDEIVKEFLKQEAELTLPKHPDLFEESDTYIVDLETAEKLKMIS